jgi:hypothetical protein
MKANDNRFSFFTPSTILRLEGLFLFFLAIYFYYHFKGPWGLFLSLFFVPDLSIAGYLLTPSKGAVIYNVFHSEIGSILLVGCYLIFSNPILLQLALIWFCHVNFDRMLGIGLKYANDFKHTHLGMLTFGKK